MAISKNVEIIPFDDPSKFIDALSPRFDLWQKFPAHWIFRGQSDGIWDLKPSAYRDESWKPFDNICGGLSTIGYSINTRIRLELNAVWWFAMEADRQGLQVPGYDHSWFGYEQLNKKFYDDIEKRIFVDAEFFPPADWRPIFAMAQHYQIPTRMLDWSESSYVAAYFASVNAAEKIYQKKLNKDIKSIAVWALNEKMLNDVPWPNDERIIMVRAPWATNSNLRAQKGLFTLHGIKLKQDDRCYLPSQDNALERIFDRIKYKPVAPIIRCLQLDVDKAPALLRLLSQIGINAASLFPGYSGVVNQAKELMYMAPLI